MGTKIMARIYYKEENISSKEYVSDKINTETFDYIINNISNSI
ncbi:hypothetical protein [Dysgonomonas sp. BGC7]|nr:hypothetical protein [Dysgonomonas sp. BGC7]